MAALSNQIDRLSRSTKAISSTAGKIQSSSRGTGGPFTRAVLSTHLGDLIRDVDPSEIGLFNLIDSSRAPHERDSKATMNPEIARIEFPGPTPLRKPPGRVDDAQKPKEIEPEVYAEAALKYLDR